MGDEILKKLFIVGIGAGNYEGMTVGAVKALEQADLIVGYTVYCKLIKPYFPDKKFKHIYLPLCPINICNISIM